MSTARLRASDADRQQAVEDLGKHFADGRLDTDEYDQRVRRAYAATYTDEFPELFGDLPGSRRSGHPFGTGFFTVNSGALSAPDAPWRKSFGAVRARPGNRGMTLPRAVLTALGILFAIGMAMVVVGVLVHLIVPIGIIALIVMLVGRRHQSRRPGMRQQSRRYG